MKNILSKKFILVFLGAFVALIFFVHGASADFSPSDISNLKLWLDASQGVTTDGSTPAVDGDTVQQWNDQSISAADATQITPASKPTYKTNILNGKPVMRFGGVQSMATSSFLDSTFNTNFTFFIVSNKSSSSAFYVSTSNQSGKWYSGRGVYGPVFNMDNLSIKQRVLYSYLPKISTDNGIETFRYDGSIETSRFDDISVGTTAVCRRNVLNNLGLNGALTVGAYSAGGFNWNGDIAEIIIYNRALSDVELVQVEQYLSTKYDTSARILPAMPDPGLNLTQIVFEGDSITSGNGSTNDLDYPHQTISALGGSASYSMFNLGVPGETVAKMTTDAASQADTLLLYGSGRPYNILSFWGGTNDLGQASPPPVDAATTYNRIVSYCQGRRTAGFKVIVNTILPRKNPASPDFETNRQLVNTWIRANWQTFADALSDVASDSRIGDLGDELNTTYFADGVHLTNAGYAIVADYVKTQIENIMDSDAPVTAALPVGGTYGTAQTITLTCDDGLGTGCATTYYTTDDSDPTTSSSEYSVPINISSNTTLKFFSQDVAGNEELINTETYVIDTAAPVIAITSPATGDTVSGDDTITFTDSEQTDPQCSLDNSHWDNCTSTVTSFSTLTSWNDISENDTFTLYMRDTDSVGNTGTASVANLTKADTQTPVRSDGSPSGALSSGTTSATLSLTTNESATCKQSTTSGTAYASMTESFSTSNGTAHSTNVSGLSSGNSYNYYIRCQDTSENANDTDYLISFSVASAENQDSDENTDNNTDEAVDEEKDLNIHSVKAESSENSITITWKTDHNTKSSVRYGTDKNLKQKKKDKDKEKKHKIVLKDLLSDTKYYFRIKAEDSDDNEDSSRIHSIKTLPKKTLIQTISNFQNENQNQSQAEPSSSNANNANPNVCKYTIQAGDTLWSIAKEVYGDATQYKKITDINQDLNTDALKIGQELKLCDNNQAQQSTTDNLNGENSNQQSEPQNETQNSSQDQNSDVHWWNPFSWF